jgi:hypothetical protein
VQPLEVAGHADPLPFQPGFFQSAQKKLPESHHALDDPKDGFHRLLPQFVSWSGWVSAQIMRTGTLSELACSMQLELKSPLAWQ